VRFLQSAVALREGRWDDAERALEASVALNPADHAAANNLAFLLSLRPTEAKRALALAITATEAMPEAAEYWDTRARCELTAELLDAAEGSWRQAVRLYLERRPVPTAACAESEVGLAELLSETDRWKESRALARRALEREPGAEVARRARALLRAP
jgi:tetratricopeptide (TPR) repeat protein